MARLKQNSIPDLVDLSARVLSADEEGAHDELKVELRVHPAQLDGPNNLTFSVGLKRLMLSLDLSGLEEVAGSRFGEPIRDNQQTQERTLSTEISVEKKNSDSVGVKLALHPEVTLKGDDSSSLKKKSTVSTTEKKVHHNVRARGNLIWEVTEPPWENTVLNATYLNDDTLCKITSQDRANSRAVNLIAYAKQKDLIFEPEKSNFLFRSTNHKKLLNVLFSKALSSGQPFN